MQRVINFLKYGSNVLIVSVILTLIGLIYTFFYHGGYNWGIDFSPRVNINLSIEKSDIKENEIKRIFSPLYKALEVNSIFSPNNNKSEFSIMVKSDVIDYAFKTEVQKTIMDELKKTFNVNIEVLDSYFIDSSFSSTLRIKSIFLVLGTFALILIYITLRFKLSYAIASILSTFHDIFFIVAFLGAFRIEINSYIIVAILTIIGYSLNDTIIIFDRIRDNVRRLTDNTFLNVLNISISQTLSRTVLTSVTTFVAVFSIYVFTEGPIKDFSLVFMVGVIVGTYSSVFIASPILLNLYKKIK
ncbi:protein translocase subunit SecF [Borreliella afzelii]|uniref:Protein-export membrane protein SecF n=2 Tax=Borreliella afzelii TaxID=29518 RepID=Q0SMK0_BORAP|nr:protein translocase subunit SecF [Borreliella afzelii]ABH01928.1 protein-export membrane protein [Borreliella afzelii PKo]AFU74956.1 preprotein translocase subunit SecF [Borreliella afzelii HLJ01]AJY72629.1 protein-export membrane protein SecF [Borreliella afzelii K78]EEC21260.1 protein-export membrane protein SecF [Borreliella afzelii ACA-1]AEL69873.1 protein-export membrane protein SecF [Borreliella afzelii PKo]